MSSLATSHRRDCSIWLDPVPAVLRDLAAAKLAAGDVCGFLFTASNEHGLALVAHNLRALQTRGLYEFALLQAFIATRTNNCRWSVPVLHWLFEMADRERLRAAGGPLPGTGPFTVYRGVSGRGRARRVRGLSWTASKEKAQWFAERGAHWSLANPAVLCVVIAEGDVLAYVNDRQEEEFVILLPSSARPAQVEKVALNNMARFDTRWREQIVAGSVASEPRPTLKGGALAGVTGGAVA